VAGAEATAMGPKLRAKGEPPPCYGKFWDDKSLQFLVRWFRSNRGCLICKVSILGSRV